MRWNSIQRIFILFLLVILGSTVCLLRARGMAAISTAVTGISTTIAGAAITATAGGSTKTETRAGRDAVTEMATEMAMGVGSVNSVRSSGMGSLG